MQRRKFLKTAGMGMAAMPFKQVFDRLSTNSGSPDRPNVLFIALDDMNDWVGCLGGKSGVHTPNVDRLAEQGTLFTRAYCSAPSCCPSRTSLLTGRRPSSTGIYYNISYFWRKNPHLKDNVTLPQYFRNNGYRTMGSGKIFHALSWISERYGMVQNDPASWDQYFPSVDNPMPDFNWPDGMKEANNQISWPPVAGGDDPDRVPPYFFDWGPLDVPESQTSDSKVVHWGANKLNENNKGQPFFLGAGIFRPHIPWFVPKKYYDMYPLEDIVVPFVPKGDLNDLPPAGRQMGSGRRSWHQWLVKNGLWKKAVQAYMASMSFADAQVGYLIDALEASRFADNTIVVLWSDHGFHLGEKGTWEKFTLWEEAGRLPLIIKAPGLTTPRSRCGEPVSLLDLYPTLAELCGLPAPDHTEGQSLVPLLKQPDREMGRAVVTTFGYQNHSIRSRRWRYIRYKDGSEELYDHDHDSGEFYNLAGYRRYKSVKKRLAKYLPEKNVSSYSP